MISCMKTEVYVFIHEGYKAKTEHKFINTVMTGRILRAMN